MWPVRMTAAMLRVYVNGELAMETAANVETAGFGSNFDALALGCLTDSTLPFMGMLDEVVLADYAFDEALIAKLYSSPEEGAAEIAGLVKANYPEDYAPATEAPEATAAPGYRYQGAGYRGGYGGENAGQDSKACRNGPFDDDCGNHYRGHCGRDCSSRRDRTGHEEKGCKKVRKS